MFVEESIPELSIVAGTAEARPPLDPGSPGGEAPTQAAGTPVAEAQTEDTTSAPAASQAADDDGCGTCATLGYGRAPGSGRWVWALIVVGLLAFRRRGRRFRGGFHTR